MNVSGILGSCFHSFWIGDEDWEYDERASLQAGMLTLGGNGSGYLVDTAAHTGYVRIILEHLEDPAAVSADDWDDVSLATLVLSTNRLYAASIGGLGQALELHLPNAGLHTVRVSGKNRVEDERSFDETAAAETYLIQIWSTSRAMQPQSIRLTSDWGQEQMMHGESAG